MCDVCVSRIVYDDVCINMCFMEPTRVLTRATVDRIRACLIQLMLI